MTVDGMQIDCRMKVEKKNHRMKLILPGAARQAERDRFLDEFAGKKDLSVARARIWRATTVRHGVRISVGSSVPCRCNVT